MTAPDPTLLPERFASLGSDELLNEFDPPQYRVHPVIEAVVVALAVMIAVMGTVGFIYTHAERAQADEIRQGLVRTARVVASLIDPELHKSFVSPEQEESPEYQAIDRIMLGVLKSDPQIAYLYTAVKKGDEVYFILDPTPKPTDPDEEDKSVNLWDKYEDANPEILQALETKEIVTSPEPYTDEWGTFISSYVPLFDANGEFYAVLGMDIEVSEYLRRLEPIRRATTRAMVAGFFVSFMIASIVWFLRGFLMRVNARRIALHAELRRRLT